MNIIKPNITYRNSLIPFTRKITKIVQHHMAHETWDIYDIHNYHKNSKGWNGLGYNFWIGFDGTIYEGRGINVGAQCREHNSFTIGIGYQGHFGKQNMTDAQLKSGIELNRWLLEKFNLSVDDIVGHNQLVSTSCPDRNFRMNELKQGVANNSAVNSTTHTSTLRIGDRGRQVESLQSDLKDLGYKVGAVDGIFGNGTESALKQFQKDNGLSADGIAGSRTYEALENKLNKSDEEGDKLNFSSPTLEESYRKLLVDMANEEKHGKSAINKVWIDRFDNGELTISDAMGLFAIHVRRGMDDN